MNCVTIVVYVTDLIITSCREDLVTSVLEKLEKALVKIVATRGLYHEYLGMVFEMKGDNRVNITMENYLANTLDDHTMIFFVCALCCILVLWHAVSRQEQATLHRKIHRRWEVVRYISKRIILWIICGVQSAVI